MKKILKQFQTIPGVGTSIAQDLWNLGLRSISDLKGKDPEELYAQMVELEGWEIIAPPAQCVHDTLASAQP